MPSAAADFPDRAPPSTSTRRPARTPRPGEEAAPVREVGEGAAPVRELGEEAAPVREGGEGAAPDRVAVFAGVAGEELVPQRSAPVPARVAGKEVALAEPAVVRAGLIGEAALPGSPATPGNRGSPGTRMPAVANCATSPITTTAGLVTPAARTAPGRSCSGAVTTRWCRLQPSDTTAPGVPAPSPAESSVSTISARWSIAISSTRVIPLRASAAQSTELCGSPGRTCPASTQKPWLTPRWVTGMPAAAGTEMALVTPGTTSTGTPAI